MIDLFDAAHTLIISTVVKCCYFDVYSPSTVEYEDKDIAKIDLTAEEPT